MAIKINGVTVIDDSRVGNLAAANVTGNVSAGNVSGTLVAGTLTTAAQPNVTSVGTLSSLAVTGNVTTGNVSGTLLTGTLATAAQPNVTSVGTLSSLSVTGNVTTGNVSGTLLTGTLATAAQPNVTSVGTLTSLTVTGNVTGGNLITAGAVTGNGAALTALNASNISTGTLAQTRLANSSFTLNGNTISLGGTETITAQTPGSLTFDASGSGGSPGCVWSGGSYTTISYNSVGAPGIAGNNATGTWSISISGSAASATTAGTVTTNAQPNITSVGTLSSLTATGNITGGNLLINNNATISGNLNVLGTETIFNVQTLTVNDLDIVVANNVTGGANINGAGILAGNPTTASFVYNNATSSWQVNVALTPNANGTLDLGKTGSRWGNAWLSTLTVTGNANVGNIGATNIVGTLSTAAQPNITSLGSLTALTVTGNANVGNLGTAGLVTATGNVSGGNLTTGGIVSATGNVSGANLLLSGNIFDSGTSLQINTTTAANISLAPNSTIVLTATTTGANITGTLNATGNANVGNLGTAGQIIATGNVQGNFFIGNGSQLTGIATGTPTKIESGTSEANIRSSGGNLTITIGGTANVGTFTTTGANISGTLNATGNANVGNLGTAGLITATGNVSGGNLTTGAQVVATGNVTGGNLNTAGAVVVSGSGAATNTTTGSIRTAGGVGVAGNIYAGGLVSVTGNVDGGNLNTAGMFTSTKTGGTANGNAQIYLNGATLNRMDFNTNGVAAPAFTTRSAGAKIVLYPNIGASAADYALGIESGNMWFGVPTTSEQFRWYAGTTLGLSLANGVLTAVGNVSGSNLVTAGRVVATGNVEGGNLIVTNNIVDTGALEVITSSNGNITFSPNGTGVVVFNKDLRNGQANGVGNIGTSTGYFNTVFAKATSAQYADLAEVYEADADYEPGTVVAFGGAKEITQSITANDVRVAGVISTAPSYIMNSALEGEHTVTVALTGRVPTRVSGAVNKGDMMVSAGDGTARACAAPQIGTVIGKALEDFAGESGVIEVVVGRL